MSRRFVHRVLAQRTLMLRRPFSLHRQQTGSKGWIRVSYHGRDDGWVLTANKRGPTAVPVEDSDQAAEEFDAQESAFAAAAAAPPSAEIADRPLTGAKPPPASSSAPVVAEERPLSGGGKGAWVPPSEFPPGHEGEVDRPVSGAGETGGAKAVSGSALGEDGGEKGFVTALG